MRGKRVKKARKVARMVMEGKNYPLVNGFGQPLAPEYHTLRTGTIVLDPKSIKHHVKIAKRIPAWQLNGILSISGSTSGQRS